MSRAPRAGEILALDNEVRSLQEKLKEMQKQLDIARDNLPLFLRQQTQRDIEEIGQQFSEILQQRQKEFRRALEGVRDAAAVAVADEVSFGLVCYS
jgi:predicted  nucleic acid-binding Zn-ribbon protein